MILLGVLQGIIVAIVLAILSCFRRKWWPHGTVLGEVPEMGGWYGTAKYPGATQLPGVVVFRWEAPLFFANSDQFRDKVRRLARERPLPGSFCSARWSLTSMSLPPKCSRLWMRSSMHLAFVEPRDRLQDLMRRYGLNTTLDRKHFYPSLDHALDAINNAPEDSPMPPDEGMPPP